MDRRLLSSKPVALLLIAGAYGLGGGGMLAWLAFILIGPPVWLELAIGTTARLLTDALLCLIFFIQHSLMVRRDYRVWLTRFIHADLHGVLYATASGASLLLLVLFWQTDAGMVWWRPPAWLRGLMIGLFLAAAAGAWWGTRALGAFDALGIRPALQTLGGRRSDPQLAFTVRGPYRWVRHPLYLFSLLIIWSGPIFTLDRLLHNGLWTLWIVIGATLEERDLVACFGDVYRSYQRSVPMLLPRSIRPLVGENGAAS